MPCVGSTLVAGEAYTRRAARRRPRPSASGALHEAPSPRAHVRLCTAPRALAPRSRSWRSSRRGRPRAPGPGALRVAAPEVARLVTAPRQQNRRWQQSPDKRHFLATAQRGARLNPKFGKAHVYSAACRWTRGANRSRQLTTRGLAAIRDRGTPRRARRRSWRSELVRRLVAGVVARGFADFAFLAELR